MSPRGVKRAKRRRAEGRPSPNRGVSDYWQCSRSLTYSVIFVAPLLILYELAVLALSRAQRLSVRNGADVLLKELFTYLGVHGPFVVGLLLGGGAAWLLWRKQRRSRRSLRPLFFALMFIEGVTYGLFLQWGVMHLQGALLTTVQHPISTEEVGGGIPSGPLSFGATVVVALGAGIYEELVFRVLLVSGLTAIAYKVFGLHRLASSSVAVVLSALLFSTFHYLGSFGDSFDPRSFLFRWAAGVMFSGLYILRGFGITAYTHTLYDLFLLAA